MRNKWRNYILVKIGTGNVFEDGYAGMFIYILSILLMKFGQTYNDLSKYEDRLITFIENEDGSFKIENQLIQ